MPRALTMLFHMVFFPTPSKRAMQADKGSDKSKMTNRAFGGFKLGEELSCCGIIFQWETYFSPFGRVRLLIDLRSTIYPEYSRLVSLDQGILDVIFFPYI